MAPESETQDRSPTGESSPRVGATVDTHTHYAHARYAAANNQGIVFFDPRDGRERFNLESSSDQLEQMDDRVMTSAAIKPFRPADFGEPADRYVVKLNYAELELFPIGDECTPPRVWPKSLGESEVVDGLEEAREYLREHVEGYEEAPRRDAIAERRGDISVSFEDS